MKEDADGVFVLVSLTLTNGKDEPAFISEFTVRLKGGNGAEYSTSTEGSMVVEDALLLEEIQPALTKQVVAVLRPASGCRQGRAAVGQGLLV